MTKMAFDTQNCLGATSGKTGIEYKTDRHGFIDVHPADVHSFKEGGYTVVGSVARASKYWTCDNCGRDCNINSCGKCGATELRKVVE